MIDFNVRAERMGWLPSAPALKTNRLMWPRPPKPPASTPRPTPSTD
jgi:nitrate reductase alpha subunit